MPSREKGTTWVKRRDRYNAEASFFSFATEFWLKLLLFNLLILPYISICMHLCIYVKILLYQVMSDKRRVFSYWDCVCWWYRTLLATEITKWVWFPPFIPKLVAMIYLLVSYFLSLSYTDCLSEKQKRICTHRYRAGQASGSCFLLWSGIIIFHSPWMFGTNKGKYMHE